MATGRTIGILLGMVAALAFGIGEALADHVRIGVLAKRGIAAASERWNPTADYLSATVPGYSFEIVPLDFATIKPAVEARAVDFVLANSAMYVALESKYGVGRIVTMENLVLGKPVTSFGGVIFRRADRDDLASFRDLKGTRFAAVDRRSLGGWIAARHEFLHDGIDTENFFSEIAFLHTHDAVVHAVLSGEFDAGTVRTDTLERMAAEGKIDLADVEILRGPCCRTGPVTDEEGYPFANARSFPFLVSTRLYPEWPMARLPHTGHALAEAVATALIRMPSDSPAALKAKVHGWTIPENYQPVHAALRHLKIAPYDQTKISLIDVFRKYYLGIALSGVLFASTVILLFYVVFINKRLKAEERRSREREAYISTIFRAAPIGIGVAVDRVVTEINDFFCQMTGLRREELIGSSTRKFYPSEAEFERVGTENYSQIDATGIGMLETRLLRRDGTLIDATISSATLDPNDRNAGIVFAALDITERKRSEERFAKTFHASPVAMSYSHIDDGRLIDANAEWLAMFGYAREEVISRTTADLDRWHPAEIRQRLIEHLNRHGSIRDFQARVRTKTDAVRDVVISGEVIEIDGDRQMLLAFHDITNRLELETQLRQAQKMEVVGQLTGGVAHDFNNLIQVIETNLELLRLRLPETDESRELAERAIRAGRRGAELTQKLLSFSRRQALRPRLLDIGSWIQEEVKLLARTLGEDIAIETKLETTDARIAVDEGGLTNAILNIALNARAAMPAGGRLTITSRRRHVGLDSSFGRAAPKPGDYVEIAVSDTGSGMSEEVRVHAFEPFFTTKGIGEGSGLGLSMVLGFAQQSGGDVTIESAPGGTTVRLLLPVAEGAPAVEPDEETAPEPVAAFGTPSILLVEDDPEVRESTVMLLESLGCDVTSAADAKAGLDILAERDEFDFLISDVVLPRGHNGIELGRQVKRRHPGIEVILVSGYPVAALKKAGFDEDDFRLLSKPYSRESLAEALKDARRSDG